MSSKRGKKGGKNHRKDSQGGGGECLLSESEKSYRDSNDNFS